MDRNQARLGFIIDRFGSTLLSVARDRDTAASAGLDAPSLVRLIADADPTRNKARTQWLVQSYIRNGFRLEDLGRASELLTLFNANRSRLAPEARDIGRYRTLPDLWDAVERFMQADQASPATGKELKRSEREQARAQSRIVRETDDGFIIAIPLTPFAASWWGRGTRWCTTSDDGYRFASYKAEGPLFVIVFPNGRKLQLHARSGQFMDETDRPVSERFIADNWDRLRSLLMLAIRKDGRNLRWVPSYLLEKFHFVVALRTDAEALQILPLGRRTTELCEIAVRRHPRAIRDVPMAVQNETMALHAARGHDETLSLLRYEACTLRVIEEAIRHRPGSIPWVPERMRDAEFCRRAVAYNGMLLQYVPEEMRTEELCRIAVSGNGQAINFVPPELQSEGLLLLAIEKGFDPAKVPRLRMNGDFGRQAMERVPEGCLAAVKAIERVPEAMRTPEFCLAAVKRDRYALGFVPRQLRTSEMCMHAIRQSPHSPDAYADVPRELVASLSPYGETELWKAFDPEDVSWLPRSAEDGGDDDYALNSDPRFAVKTVKAQRLIERTVSVLRRIGGRLAGIGESLPEAVR